jgi:hypothetical protein
MPQARAVAVLSLMLLIAGPGCSGPPDISECHGQIQMSVTPGLTPVFNWAPECMIGYLVVEDRGDGAGYWNVSSPPGQNIIAPPVTFRVVPDGATEDGPSFPLVQGGAYRVVAFLVDQDQNGEFTILRIGEQPFNYQ